MLYEEDLLLEEVLETGRAAVDRRSPAYIRWVQQALNQVGRAGLAVDGRLGPRTKNAIRLFQRLRGLKVDGVAGPATEAALVAAGASPPSQAVGQAPSPKAPVSGMDLGVGPLGTLAIEPERHGLPSLLRFRYSFTAEDLLWTGRFIVGEAGGRDDKDNEAVIWTMFNRYAFFTHPYYPTFHQFIRKYSTPLQPVLQSSQAAKRHMDSPNFVRTGGNYPGTNIPKGQTQRHIKLQATPWSQLPATARSLATRALRGQVANPIGNASEFISTYILLRHSLNRLPSEQEWLRYTENFKRDQGYRWIGLVPGLNQKKNAFFVRTHRVNPRDPNSPRFSELPKDTVRVIQTR